MVVVGYFEGYCLKLENGRVWLRWNCIFRWLEMEDICPQKVGQDRKSETKRLVYGLSNLV